MTELTELGVKAIRDGVAAGMFVGAVGIAALPVRAGAAVVVSCATGAGARAASCSLLHSIHSSVATMSQARRRKTRVWFIR